MMSDKLQLIHISLIIKERGVFLCHIGASCKKSFFGNLKNVGVSKEAENDNLFW